MIRNQWYIIAESKEIKSRPVSFRRMGENLVLWRDSNGQLSCMADKCTHRGVALSLGKIKEGRLQCPFHGLEFKTDGTCSCIPANGRKAAVDARFNANAYLTYENHGFVWIFWGEAAKVTPPPAFFDNLDGLHYNSRQDIWTTHYSRAIENQLDVAHLPFIHRKTIGKGGRALVDGPVVRWSDENRFKLYVFNREDDGTAPKRPDELSPGPEGSFHLELVMPNLWQNYIARKMRIVVAFVPVDDENTIMYLRFYQGFITLPVLRGIFNFLFMPFNIRILHEDRRVVISHQPKRSQLRSGENLFQADLPIIEYRKRREKLLEEAGR
jgi:phenylpropionate dioxygenase-like ring-hydroxylating dioxygenase large terminal subunit